MNISIAMKIDFEGTMIVSALEVFLRRCAI